MTKTRATLLAVLLVPAFGQPAVAAPPAVTFQIPGYAVMNLTTTFTPWDSSEFSSASSNGEMSGGSSSVEEPGSLGSFKWSSSGSSDAPYGSSRSSDSDMSNSASWTGSQASGSSGSYLRIYQWFLILFLLCCCVVSIGAVVFIAKPQKSRKAPRAQERMPPPEAVMEQRLMEEQAMPIMEPEPMPALEPLPTTATLIPSYSTPAVTTSYAAPMTYPQGMPMQMAAPIQTMATSFAPQQAYSTYGTQSYGQQLPAQAYYTQPQQTVPGQATYSYAQPGGSIV